MGQVVENDPFGIAAHVLAARYGCSASQCSAFAMLTDTSKVVANLNARTYENLVSRYAPSWQGQGGPAISAFPGQDPAVAAVSSLLGQGRPVVAPGLRIVTQFARRPYWSAAERLERAARVVNSSSQHYDRRAIGVDTTSTNAFNPAQPAPDFAIAIHLSPDPRA